MRHPFHRATITNNRVWIGDDDIIYLWFEGSQTGNNTAPIYEQTKALIAQLRAAGKPVLMLGDVSRITTQDSGSRVQAKKLMELDFDANAIYGTSKLMPIIMYVMRSINFRKVRAFRNRREAMLWLQGKEHRAVSPWPAIIASSLLLVGVLGLIGWMSDHEGLTRIYPTFPAIQPLELIALIVCALAILGQRTKAAWLTPLSACGMFLIGAAILLPDSITHLTQWRFSAHATIAPSVISAVSGWICILIGIVLALTMHKQKPSVNYVSNGALCVVILLCLLNNDAYIYSHAFLFGAGDAFHASPLWAFLLLVFALGTNLLKFRKPPEIFKQISWISIAIIITVIGVELLTAISWRDTSAHARDSARQAFKAQVKATGSDIDSRLQTYVNALYGFRGLFNSSDQVSEADFSHYYDSLNLQDQYKGFRAIGFIQAVAPKDVQSVVQAARNDRTLYPEGNPAFTTPQASDEYFIIRYLAGSKGTGVNLALDPARRSLFEQARDSGAPSASSTVTFAATATQKEGSGFIITLPIYKGGAIPQTIAERRTKLVGFVNAIFNYTDLFRNALPATPGFATQIFDKTGMEDHMPLFKLSDKQVDTTDDAQLMTQQTELYAAGRPWVLVAEAPKDFGGDGSQESLALTILYGGNALSILLIFVLYLETQSRRRAMRLAEAMTQDLNAERNNAIALQHKDEALLSSIGDGVFALDMDGHVILFNKAAAEITGFASDDVLGKPYTEVLHFINESTAAVETSFIEHALKGKVGSMSKHTAIVHKQGNRIPVADSAAPIIDAQGKQIGAIVVFRDVTHERQLEQAKDEFVSLVSHQLRTPLTAIRLFIEMLLADQVGKISPEQRDYLDKVNTSTQRMIQLVGDFLNTSRIELGRLKVEPVATDLAELVGSHIDEVQPLADAKKITISFKKAHMPQVTIDPSLYGQIAHNLLTNAIRYTPEGGTIQVAVHKHDRGYQLDVSDTGIGIPKEAQAKLFQRFFRADNAIKVEGEGSGLGLYLIKKIVELSKGKIWFESEQGKGTTFHVIIPEEGMKAKAGAASLK